MNILSNPNRIAENYGLRIAAGLIAYFFLMKFINLGHNAELRLLNLVILTGGIWAALRKFKETHTDRLNYFRGLIMGVATGAVASLVFGVFLFLYMQLDQSFMDSIRANEPMGRYLNPYMASFIVVLEGFFSGLLMTFVLLNWVTTDEVNTPLDKELVTKKIAEPVH
ncbi:MAG TPA: DUF4199 domain-containing protein [Chryseolinea sp.]|nr:DUF4199 domain-containing protein [Chryseolinea sp.]